MRLFSFFLVCLIFSLVLADQPDGGFDRDLTDNRKFGNKRIQLIGRSGQIRVLPANATRGDVFTQLKWLKLEEWDAQHHPVQSINNFASQSATWGTPSQATVNGIDATSIKLTGSVSVGGNGNGNGNGGTSTSVPIVITVYLFNRTVTVDNGNTTVTVDVNSIKFNVEITGWPFKSPNNSLAFGVQLTSGGGRGQDQEHPDVATGPNGSGPKPPGRAHQIQFGPGSLVSPKTAQIDGVDTPITVLYEGRNLVWIFPYFASTLKYDPTLGTDGTTTSSNGATMMQPSVLVLMLAIATYLFRA